MFGKCFIKVYLIYFIKQTYRPIDRIGVMSICIFYFVKNRELLAYFLVLYTRESERSIRYLNFYCSISLLVKLAEVIFHFSQETGAIFLYTHEKVLILLYTCQGNVAAAA